MRVNILDSKERKEEEKKNRTLFVPLCTAIKIFDDNF